MSSGSGAGLLGSLPIELEAIEERNLFGYINSGDSILGMNSPLSTDVNSVLSTTVSDLETDDLMAASPLKQSISKLLSSKDKFAKMKSSISAENQLKPAAITAAAFAHGLSQFANISIPEYSLDSHSNHENNHKLALTKSMEKVAEWFKAFKETKFGDTGKSLFDHTTFLVVSDFSRTSALNTAKGKDHNPLTNSCILAGGHIRGGATIGGSTLISRERSKIGIPYFVGSTLDRETYQIRLDRKDTFILRPEHIHATVLAALGIPRNYLPDLPERFKSLAPLLKT